MDCRCKGDRYLQRMCVLYSQVTLQIDVLIEMAPPVLLLQFQLQLLTDPNGGQGDWVVAKEISVSSII